jgi:cobalt-precorrin-5B (C1)-methyltransferase
MKSGYTLPVFAIAAAKAAIITLQNLKVSQIPESITSVEMDLLEAGNGDIPISQIAVIDYQKNQQTALAIALSDPGDNLDLTAGTPIWAWVSLETHGFVDGILQPNSISISERLILEGGEGLGKAIDGKPAIYQLAQNLAQANLLPLLSSESPDQFARVRFILPEGRALAKRTSNAAFGILEGLSLLGTSAISQPLSVEDKLAEFRADLRDKATDTQAIAFYIGANGYQVAQGLGFSDRQLVQTANWIGAMLIEAALLGIEEITLIGYHGKLLKLAGGIFNTSSHLADARIDILVRAAVHQNLPMELIQKIERSPTAEAVHNLLIASGHDRLVFAYITDQICERAIAYIQKYSDRQVEVKTILCDRLGKLVLR